MPIKVKYVGPLDTKVFRDYTFVRCVTDDASNPHAKNPTPGEMAVELPDAIANEALKHREVFLQWYQPVPAHVKALRLQRTDALRAEGEADEQNWLKYVVIAEMLPDDTDRKKTIKQNEVAGAKRQVEVARAKIARAFNERAAVLREMYGENPPKDLVWVDAGAAAAAALADQYREAAENKETENQRLRAELEAMRAQMERDGRLTPDEEVAAPLVGDIGVAVKVDETAETPEDFPDVFGDGKPTHGVDTLGLTGRVAGALKSAGLATAEVIATKTAAELLALPNFGEASVAAVRDALAPLGLTLAGE